MPSRGAKASSAARKSRGRGSTGDISGAFETSQAVVRLRPEYGRVVRIPRSVVYDWTLPAADQAFLVDWSLADVPNVTEFTSLFKQWRLRNTRITINWRSANESTPTRPVLYFGVDPFMTTAPASLNEVMQRPHRTWTPNNTRTVLQLNVDAGVIQLSASSPSPLAQVTNSLAPKSRWFDTTQTATAYGVFWCWVSNWRGGNSGGSLTITQDYDFEFRGVQ